MARDFRDIIGDRRDSRVHSREDLDSLARGASDGSIPDYQLSAWLMAAVLNPLSFDETVSLTLAMAESGDRLDLSSLPRPHLDKHSTGGVGDKTTIVLLPMLAACGLTVVKMSGAGLGITGGTVDKLKSIPGFNVDLTADQMVGLAARSGIALSAQTSQLAPADKVLYSLREATATTASIPLIVASILSKKIAGGAEIVSIDVKCGSGGFMPTLEDSIALKDALVKVGERCGLHVEAEITDMSQPLGRAVGNALEIREALQVIGNEPLSTPSKRFLDLCLELASMSLVATSKTADLQAARDLVLAKLQSGEVKAKAEEWFLCQGGPASLTDIYSALPRSEFRVPIVAPASGFVHRLDAGTVGRMGVELGGGRLHKGDEIDYSVGIDLEVYVSSPVTEGQVIGEIHANNRDIGERLSKELQSKIEISREPVAPIPVRLL